MRQIHIALGLLQQGDNFLLQLRNGEEKIGAAGLIGCFGGKVDQGEDPLGAFCREVAEETSLRPKPDEVKSLGEINIESDYQLEPVRVKGYAFHWMVNNAQKNPKATEGKLVMMTLDEALNNLDKLTAATVAILKNYKEQTQ